MATEMIDKDLLELLACPETHSPLHLADEDLIGWLNGAIAAGTIQNREGEPVCEPVEGGLVRSEGDLLFPIRQGIPVLLLEKAIPVQRAPDRR